MLLFFFTTGFVCFVAAITIYLKKEDTAFDRTMAAIKDMKADHMNYRYTMSDYIDGLHKTLGTHFETLDQKCTQQIDRARTDVDTDLESLKLKLQTLDMHVVHIRKDLAGLRVRLVREVEDMPVVEPVKNKKPQTIKRKPGGKRMQKAKPKGKRGSYGSRPHATH